MECRPSACELVVRTSALRTGREGHDSNDRNLPGRSADEAISGGRCLMDSQCSSMPQRSSAGALAGLRIIDLTQVLAGPFCTQLLSDHGADVVKVEPLRGDETRHLGPYREDDELRSYGGYYQSVNRNKRSIAIDLKSAEGKEMLLRLIEGADA